MSMKQYEFWFLVGSQDLYGEETIRQANEHAKIMVNSLDSDASIPCKVVYKPVVLTPKLITDAILAANNDENCAGIITWMHTFSPSKMWIAGLSRLQKPMLHFNTQFNRDIPWNEIDMDFMNLNQSAHGDREHGFIGARLRVARKVISGYWEDAATRDRIGNWMRAAVGAYESRRLKVCRFGDNMRQVAVTEGDKVEAQLKLGWEVNGYGIGDLISKIDKITEAQVDAQMDEYKKIYDIKTDNIESVRYQAKLEIAIRQFLEEGGFGAYTDTFEDLQAVRQLPGLATQDLMRDGYGFGGEGDWKTAALDRVMKLMASGLPGGTAFMEDYTYHMEPGREAILGAHMLEVDPSISVTRPQIEVHDLGIGGREAPARLTFQTGDGSAIVATLIDMGDRFRMIVNDVEACSPYEDMPKLPVARVMWKPLPSLSTSAEAWILAGGAHHTVMSYQLNAEHMRDFCEILGIEFIHINKDTTIPELSKELVWNDIVWKLK